jgi:signal transduction histidine kinase
MTSDPEAANGLRAIQETVTRLQSMESVVRLTAGAGHEFNNLIQTVLGSLQLVQRLIIAGRLAETDKYIESAIRASRTAGEINQRLVSLAQPHDLNPKRLEMNELITGMAGLLRCLMPRPVALRVDLTSDLWPTYCDHHRAEIALLNLVLTARDAVPGRGTITLATRNRRIERDELPSIDLMPGSYVLAEAVGEAQEEPNETDAATPDNRTLMEVVRRFAADNGGSATFDINVGHAVVAGLLLPRLGGPHD